MIQLMVDLYSCGAERRTFRIITVNHYKLQHLPIFIKQSYVQAEKIYDRLINMKAPNLGKKGLLENRFQKRFQKPTLPIVES